jgi:hypothetical protein
MNLQSHAKSPKNAAYVTVTRDPVTRSYFHCPAGRGIVRQPHWRGVCGGRLCPPKRKTALPSTIVGSLP